MKIESSRIVTPAKTPLMIPAPTLASPPATSSTFDGSSAACSRIFWVRS